jgi:hypothetical protein
MLHNIRRCLGVLLLALLAAPLNATWSIILIDTRTGEIAIASATCLVGFDLPLNASVVVVGYGAAAAQSFIDTSGNNRQLLFTQLRLGTAPAQILALLAASDPGHQTRQYGIVDTQGRAIGFTGTGDGQWAGDLIGQVGTIVYAVQGNVLTGQGVITAAEQALRNTTGDLADKLIAAMEAARLMGGDGRCSCNPTAPTACGSPPPSFTKSAHIGYMIVARPGDTDGVCNGTQGCANGSYYLNINVANQPATAPDPVLQLRTALLNFRLNKILRPDHFLSGTRLDPSTLLADGTTQATLEITLRDWRGVRIPYGGASITPSLDAASSAAVTFGAVVDHGDGSYSLPITAGTQVGVANVRLVVDDGYGAVQLGPDTAVNVTGDALWVEHNAFDAAAGGNIDFVLAAGAARANRFYVLLASASGTTPGIPIPPSLVMPLNPDPLLWLSLDLAASGAFPDLYSTLDGSGRKAAQIQIPPGVLQLLQGGALSFAYGTLNPIDFVSNPVSVDIR